MGLLAALDYHAKNVRGETGESQEVEYRLLSWGEIVAPILGDREHSFAARHILRHLPFTLFASSRPYSTLPQKLSLGFRAPSEDKSASEMVKHQGYFPEEIAQEFAAFISLVTRRRVFDSHSNRLGNWPIEDEQQPYRRPPRQEPQRLREIDPERIYMLLEHLRVLDRSTAEGFVLAMRLYHAAIEAMYSDPEAAYLLLVMTLEAVSSIVNRGYKPDADEFLDSRFPGWRAFTPSGNIEAMKATLLANEHYAFRKLVKFVEDNAPATFWTDTHDDAKPTSMRTDLQPWERIEKAKLRASLRSVYDARSGLTHTGARLPPSIVLGHLPLVPTAAVVEGLASSVGEGPVKLPVPPLLTVERLVSQCMVTYLERSAPVTDEV